MRLMCSDGADGRRTRSRSDFKANPVPKNLFSDQVYDQMREDQFYRALRKKIRAQEMLESAKKPPSMEARDAIPKKVHYIIIIIISKMGFDISSFP